ncbi:hypothetical protein IIA16_06935, partial [bacterium]|nr:hypothetical protein [bacterium]
REWRRLLAAARLPGFRPGKVPRSVMEKMVTPEEIAERVAARVWREGVGEILAAEGIRGLELLRLDHKRDRKGLSIEAELEVVPPFKVPDLKTLKVEAKAAALVTEEEVSSQIGRMVNAETRLVTADTLAEGDYFRLEGTFSAGEHTEDVARAFEANERTLPSASFLAKVTGATAGDRVVFETKFSEAYTHPELAGKMVAVEATIVSVRRENKASPATIAAGHGLADESELRDRVKTALGEEREQEAFAAVEKRLPAALLAGVPRLKAPASLVAEAKAAAWEDAKAGAVAAGSEEPDEEAWWQENSASVEDSVRLGLVMDAIAEQWGVETGQFDLEIFYHDVARRVGRPVRKIVQEARRRGEIAEVARRIRHAKVSRRLARQVLEREEGRK